MHKSGKSSPEWLNVELLQKAVRNYKNDYNVQIKDFSIQSGFSEHIASEMFQCKIDFESCNSSKCETLNVVIKARSTTNEVAADGPLFENEIQIYTNTIPLIHRLFERNGIKINLAPE